MRWHFNTQGRSVTVDPEGNIEATEVSQEPASTDGAGTPSDASRSEKDGAAHRRRLRERGAATTEPSVDSSRWLDASRSASATENEEWDSGDHDNEDSTGVPSEFSSGEELYHANPRDG